MKIQTVFVSAAIALMIATPAVAGGNEDLEAGGNTIAGPGSVKSVIDAVNVIAASVNENVCVTVQNSGKKAGVNDVKLDLIDDSAGITSGTVSGGATAALCQENNESVQVTCLGPKTCSYSWRIDKK